MKYIYILLVNLIAAGFFAQTQVGPGGVGTSSTIAFWLDASDLGVGNGNPVGTWTDRSGNGNDFTQGSGGLQPTLVASSGLNSLPGVLFDGSDDFISSSAISALDGVRTTTFSVTKLDAGSMLGNPQVRYVFENNYSNFSALTRYGYIRDNNTRSRIVGSTRNSAGTYRFVSSEITTALYDQVYLTSWSLLSNFDTQVYVNGTSSSVTGTNASIGTHVSTVLGMQSSPALYYFKGLMSDIITYNTVLNTAQNTIVQNYLAAKYNLSLGAIAKFDNASTHSFDVAGIGRDNASNQHLSARGTGIVEVTSSSLTDGAYLLWGHDNAGFATTTSNVPAAYSSSNGSRLTQTWKVSETSETGDVELSFDLTGITFGYIDDYELLIDANSNFSSATRVSGVAVGDVITFTVLGADLEDDYFFTIGNPQTRIVSIADGLDWDNTAAWSCSCIPTSLNDVIIDAGHTVTVNTAEEVGGLIINPTGELAINSTFTLDVFGNVTVNGLLTMDALSNLNFFGTLAQTVDVSGTLDVGSLEVNNALGVTFNTGSYTFSGVLTATDGNIDFNSNSVTFKSDASSTGAIGVIGTGTFSGISAVAVERFIDAGVAGLRSMGTPFTTMKLSEWDDEIFISGTGFPDGCAYSSSGCYYSAKTWDANTQGYADITNLSTDIPAGTGIEIFLGDNLNTWSAHTLSASGQIYLDADPSIDITLKGGWNFVSNPFLSPVDFDNIIKSDASNTGNYFYVYDESTPGSWHYWNGITQSASTPSLSGGVISSFQGFWVYHNSASTETLTVNQASKSASTPDAFVKSDEFSDFTLKLLSENQDLLSSSQIIFSSEYTSMFESYDVLKVPFDNYSYVSMKTEDDKKVTVNALSIGEECYSIPLQLNVMESGKYSLKFKNIPYGYEAVLVDLENGLSRRVFDEDTPLQLDLNEGLIDAKYELKLSKIGVCQENIKVPNIALSYSKLGLHYFVDNGLKLDGVTVMNILGESYGTSKIISKSSHGILELNLIPGVYIASFTSVDGKVENVKFVVE